MRARILVAAALFAALATTAACTSAQGTPSPASTSSSGMTTDVITSPPSTSLGAPAHPPQLALSWRPGSNWRSGQKVHGDTAGKAVTAVRHDIAVAPRLPLERYACPLDTGVGVRLVFSPQGPFGQKRVLIGLDGCPHITVPGHKAQRLTRAVANDLRPFAPKRWRAYLADY